LKKTRPHEAVVATVERLIAEKRRDERLWRDLYRDGRPGTSTAARSGMPRPGIRARMNVVRNACETLHARVAKNQPRPWIVTVGGDWKLQRRAKNSAGSSMATGSARCRSVASRCGSRLHQVRQGDHQGLARPGLRRVDDRVVR
jgi:hypothetical protein